MRFLRILAVFLCLSTPLRASIRVEPSRSSFDPSLKQRVVYNISTTESGVLSAEVLDRDTYVTKTLVRAQRVSPGAVALTWDGTDKSGRIVPDEAWSLRIVLKTPRGEEIYMPAANPADMVTVTPDFYDKRNGVLRYRLAAPSRVHLQAGIADRKSNDPTAGAVMKTIVNRAPRPAGAVIEQWTGMDESGSIYVPELPNFVVSIAATPLPEASVITFGNRSRDFVSSATERSGIPLIRHDHAHAHHGGLSTLDDVAPQLTIKPENATWRADQKRWSTTADRLKLRLAVEGPTASHFKRQPATITVYIDEKKVVDRAVADDLLTIALPAGTRDHVIAVNWNSAYGPVAANAFRLQHIAR